MINTWMLAVGLQELPITVQGKIPSMYKEEIDDSDDLIQQVINSDSMNKAEKIVELTAAGMNTNEIHLHIKSSRRYVDAALRKAGMFKKTRDAITSSPVIQFSLACEFIKEFESGYLASKELSISRTQIFKVCRGINKKAGGYIFKYKKDVVKNGIGQ